MNLVLTVIFSRVYALFASRSGLKDEFDLGPSGSAFHVIDVPLMSSLSQLPFSSVIILTGDRSIELHQPTLHCLPLLMQEQGGYSLQCGGCKVGGAVILTQLSSCAIWSHCCLVKLIVQQKLGSPLVNWCTFLLLLCC